MKTPLRLVLPLIFMSMLFFSAGIFAQGQNGFNLQNRTNKRTVFVAENCKIKVWMDNGKEITGCLSGADSNAIYITPNNGKQRSIPIVSINKMTVFHPHDYFTLMGGLTDAGIAGCGNDCNVIVAGVVLVGIVAITAGELIVDGLADIANDEHFDLQNSWKIAGPVVAQR